MALLLSNIAQLLTLRGPAGPRRGPALDDIGMVREAAVLCDRGKIVAAGPQREVLRHPLRRKNKRLRELDCRGRTVLPGFVDSHTHPVFAGPRLIDFEQRIAGASYEAIAAAGGGIRSSVSGVRSAGTGKLAQQVLRALAQMQAHGTTCVEAKSGYGLTVESELKSLLAIRMAGREWPGTIVSTLLGAHVVPAEWKDDADEYVRQVCDEMVPQAARRKLAAFVDVFCERGAFTLEQAVRVLESARRHGLGTRAHVGQFTACSLDPLLQQGPASLDHLDHFHQRDLQRLAAADTVATLVPAANYFLGHDRYPNARKLIASGAAVALATDFNPGTAPTPSIPFVLSLACTHLKMRPAEAVSAATINGAYALGLGERKGSIEEGKDADLAVFDVPDYREMAYWVGVNLCAGTIIAGQWQASSSLH